LAASESAGLLHIQWDRNSAAVRAAPTAVLGVGLVVSPALLVQAGNLAAGDVVAREWNVAVVGPHYSGTLVARDLGDRGPELERRFEFALTFDRELGLGVAGALLARLGEATSALELVA